MPWRFKSSLWLTAVTLVAGIASIGHIRWYYTACWFVAAGCDACGEISDTAELITTADMEDPVTIGRAERGHDVRNQILEDSEVFIRPGGGWGLRWKR